VGGGGPAAPPGGRGGGPPARPPPRGAAALLGVLKSGAAYVPLDLTHPAGRLAHVLSEVAPAAVLAESGADLPVPPGSSRVDLDTPDVHAALAAEPAAGITDADRTAPLRPEHPAYVIYTSGSTGRPKGVVVTHRGLSNLFQHQFQVLYPAATEGRRLRVALTAALSFDASFDPLLWMVAGHELHLIDDDTRRDPAALVEYTTRAGIDFLELTPAYYEQLLAHGLLSEDHRSRPHLIALGGEAVSEPLWRQLCDTPGMTGYNLYGPTECTIDSVCATTATSARPAIGRPVSNARTYVLDGALRPVPPGVAGTVVEVRVFQPGAIARVDKFVMRKAKNVAEKAVEVGLDSDRLFTHHSILPERVGHGRACGDDAGAVRPSQGEP
jgi:non-ribosomal peptide synthetase component F